MIKHYILDGKEPKEVDLVTWARWMETSKNFRIALDEIGPITVSTVFLGLDRGFGQEKPVLFETLVWITNLPTPVYETFRYCTYEEAEEGHALQIKRAGSRVQDVNHFLNSRA